MTKRFKEGKGCGKDFNICISDEMFLTFHLVEMKDGKQHVLCAKHIVIY